MYRVVLDAPAEYLECPLYFFLPADDGVQFSFFGEPGQVCGKALEEVCLWVLAFLCFLRVGFCLRSVLVVILVKAVEGTVRNNFQQLEPVDASLAEVVGRVVFFLVKETDKDFGYSHLFLSRVLGLKDSPFYNILEPGCLHGFPVLDLRNLLLEVGLHTLDYVLHIGGAFLENGAHFRKGERRVQEVLGGEILVVAELGFVVSRVKNCLNLGADFHGVLYPLHDAFERITLAPGPCVHLVDLGSRDIVGIHAKGRLPRGVDKKHELRGLHGAFMENPYDDVDNKVHGSKIVVEHDDLVFLGKGMFRFLPLEHRGLVIGLDTHYLVKIASFCQKNKVGDKTALP